LAADFSKLGVELKKVESVGADLVHIDIMDAHFVPNLTIGPAVVGSLNKVSNIFFDVHLMIEKPLDYTSRFIDNGADLISFHIETCSNSYTKKVIRQVRIRNKKVAIALNPATSLEKVKPYLEDLDMVLLMTVNPGFGGQAFIKGVLPKIKKLRKIFAKDIQIDGGINDKTAKLVVEAGANVLVAGTYIFKSNNYRDAIRRLRNV
ncbi:MAG: ribulose-phosphate 3-epimerase, partial [Candidatus Omnitrophota bacterium]